jgi:hypothetical protein
MLISRNPNVVWRRETKGGVSDGLLLLNYSTRGIHFLEGKARRIWEECHGASLEELVERLDGAGHEEEILAFLKDLEKRGLVSLE